MIMYFWFLNINIYRLVVSRDILAFGAVGYFSQARARGYGLSIAGDKIPELLYHILMCYSQFNFNQKKRGSYARHK